MYIIYIQIIHYIYVFMNLIQYVVNISCTMETQKCYLRPQCIIFFNRLYGVSARRGIGFKNWGRKVASPQAPSGPSCDAWDVSAAVVKAARWVPSRKECGLREPQPLGSMQQLLRLRTAPLSSPRQPLTCDPGPLPIPWPPSPLLPPTDSIPPKAPPALPYSS